MEKDHKVVWSNCLEIIKDNIAKEAFNTYFRPIIPISLNNNILVIQVNSHFIREYIEDKFLDILSKTLKMQLGSFAKLEYQVLVDRSIPNNVYSVNIPTSNVNKENPPIPLPNIKAVPTPFVIPGLKKLNINSQLNEEYTFDNFIEGDCNRLARSAGIAIAQNPGRTAFNPIFIYSQTGLGKSHLCQAIGLETKRRFPEKTVLYVSAEQFMHQFVDASTPGKGNQADFVNFYQMIDVLIIDDIQCLSGRIKTQDVFFHIFNHLHQKRNQLIFASDRPPTELKGIEDRLIGRFKWGLSADLQPPDLETRKKILLSKSYKDGIVLPDEVVDYLAQSITTNIRELEGARLSLVAQASFNKKEINIDLARKMIDKFVINTSKEVSIDYIQKLVCDYFNITIDVLNSNKRQRPIVQARQLVMYFAKEYTKSSLASIGNYCGNRDHATVLHALRTVNNLRETDKQFRASFNDLEKKIKTK